MEPLAASPPGVPGHCSVPVGLLLSARGPSGSPLWPQAAGFPPVLGLDVSGRQGELDPWHEGCWRALSRLQGWRKGWLFEDPLPSLGGVSWGPQEQQGTRAPHPALKEPEGTGSGHEGWASWGTAFCGGGARPGKQVWRVGRGPCRGLCRAHR